MISQFASDPKLQNLLNSLFTKSDQFKDEEIISQVEGYLPSYSCDDAASGYFSIISHICYFRPDLDRRLMKIAIRPLYYYGITDPQHAISWVSGNVKRKRLIKKNYYYYTSKQGRLWIDHELKNKANLIVELIEEIKKKDDFEIEV
ncbi:hypothetical protein [Cohnella fermenti]|uniref:Uncharacterized protein n=1 Tax=Cohnella fermenti TaxID=2565925 RepID=A0A4V6RXK0_9BACL|nr:hypothetical protein [Cohnella fermenti]THF78468.1 hypothetical protein E6C55_14780 [Cohnella fermenti]